MKYLSVCSGIEAATVAWHPLGWEAFAYSEIEKFPCKVLAHHYPNTPNLGDMTKYQEWPDAAIDLLVGGTPCQSFSIAGLREGLADPRGNLMLTYLAIAAKYRPKWLVWENVPGVLSSNGGNDFASLLRGMAELRYGFAYRVLDAQYFGVAQLRRRVFVIGCLRDWRSAASVLSERHSLSRHPAPSRKIGEKVAPTVSSGSPYSRTGNARVEHEAIVEWPHPIAGTLDAHYGEKLGLENQHIFNQRGSRFVASPPPHTFKIRGGCEGGGKGYLGQDEATFTITTGQEQHLMTPQMQIRRLTPRECERLQGFQEDYTLIAPNTPDGPRYKALGNSMAVPVMQWIGERINAVNAIHRELVAA